MSRPTTSAIFSPKGIKKEKKDPFKIEAIMDREIMVSNKDLVELINRK